MGFPIQISADQLVFANPRSFSQLITSFFGSQCLGIHPMLLLLNQFSTWSLKCFEILACISFSDCEEDFSSYSRLFVQVLPCTLGCLTLFTRIIISFLICSFQGTMLTFVSSTMGSHEPPVLFAALYFILFYFQKMFGTHLSSRAVTSKVFSAA